MAAQVRVRPIEPEDRELLAQAFERLSPEARYRRFFSPISKLSERQLDYLTRVDHADHEALVALAPDGSLVGVARYVRTGPGEAEPAMVVADDWQGQGVATVLLDRLVDRALDTGITTFKAPVLAGNSQALHVLSRLGDTQLTRRGSEVELTIALREEAPRAAGMQGLLHAVAEGLVDPLVTFWHRLLPRGARAPAVDEERANVVICAIEPELGPDPPAAALVQQIAQASGAAVVLAGARSTTGIDTEQQRLRLRRLEARLRSHGVDARTELRTGDLAAVVLDLAIAERARLIVVDDPGETDAAGRLIGSVWDHVSHHAPCSVLVAR
jgi:GNAT superfamily N-acetyltransferase